MKLSACTFAQAPEILAIFNEAIANSTALYDYKPRTMAMMETWFETKAKGNYPVLGAFEDDGSLAGFASYGTFRAWAGYKYSVEHSVYVQAEKQRRGLGRLLLGGLIEAAKQQNFHTMIGGLDSENLASVRLHLAMGFTLCASIKQAGFKFGQWRDLEFYQLILPTPLSPNEE
jgi:phosphinothricin acetyltransferase